MTNAKTRAALAALFIIAAFAAAPARADEGLFGANLAAPASGTHAAILFTPASGKVVRVLGIEGVVPIAGGDAHPRAVVIDAANLTWATGPTTLTDALGVDSSTAQAGSIATSNLPSGIRHFLQGGFPFVGGFELPEGKALLVFSDAAASVNYSILFDEQ